MIPPTPAGPEAAGQSADELEAVRFLTRIRGVRPLVTFTLLAFLAAVFAAEMTLGGSEASPTLAHMGANVVARTRAGELERLLSASTLHAGPAHAAMNLYVLYALGRTMEALVGRGRYLVLYVLSALGGGIGTTLFSGAVLSVGASGAMWGLLGAMGALAFRPSGLVPARALPGWRRMALTNLGLNVFVSFSPGVDLWAHAGGGLVGGALVGSGLLTAGLSLDRPVRESRFGAPFAALAGVLVVLLAASVGLAWWRGRPWELSGAPTYERRAVPEAGWSLEVPALLPASAATTSTDFGPSRSFGVIQVDPYVILVLATPLATPDPAARAARLAAGRPGIDAFDPRDGATPLGPPTAISPGGNPGVLRSWRYPNGLLYHRVVVLVPTHEVLLEVVAWSEYEGSAAVAERVAGSIAPL